MKTSKHLALTALGFFLTGCAGMSKTQSALVGAAACGAGGAGVGAAVAHHGINGSHVNEAIGAGIGLVTGALICGGLAYLIAQEPPPPPPPPPPPTATTTAAGAEAATTAAPATSATSAKTGTG